MSEHHIPVQIQSGGVPRLRDPIASSVDRSDSEPAVPPTGEVEAAPSLQSALAQSAIHVVPPAALLLVAAAGIADAATLAALSLALLALLLAAAALAARG